MPQPRSTIPPLIPLPTLKLPLRLVLTVPFLLQLFVAVGVISWASWRSGQRAVNEIAAQLRQEISHRVQEKLETYVAMPHLVNQLNADAMRLGQLPGVGQQNSSLLTQHLWQQLQRFDSVSTVAMANQQGGLIGVMRIEDDSIRLYTTDGFAKGDLHSYTIDPHGKRRYLKTAQRQYDARLRPWYQAATQAKRATWTEIYQLLDQPPRLSIAAVQPLYDRSGQLQGVLSTSLFLSQLDTFLSRLDVGRSGQTFIIERSGLLVATSTGELPFVVSSNGKQQQRLNAIESKNPLTSSTARYLFSHYGHLNQITRAQQMDFSHRGERQFVQVVPFPDARGLDWLIVVVLPESDFMGQINSSLPTTLGLCAAALTIAIVVGLLIAQCIAQPILQINDAAQAISNGQFEHRITEAIPVSELGAMAVSFNQMAQQLHESGEKFATVFHTSPDPIWITTLAADRYLEVNDSFLRLFGYTHEQVMGLRPTELGVEIDASSGNGFSQLLQAGGVRSLEFNCRTKNGDIRTLLLSTEPIEMRGQPCILFAGKDITERKQAEAVLKDSEAKLSNILASVEAVIAQFRLFANQDWAYEFFSSAAEAIFGYPAEELQANKNLWLSRMHPEDAETVIPHLFGSILAERRTKAEFRFLHRDGTWRWIADTIVPRRDEAANCWVVTCVEIDITERKRAEAALQTSLQEKEALLKEVHHRVKNNLQVVSSLLDLQSQRLPDRQTRAVFRSTQNRIRSMALIHEKLYQSAGFSKIDFADYIRSLSTELLETYALNPDQIALHLQLDSATLSIDTAIPCGLILNELISNALKHGFPNNTIGKIWIQLNCVQLSESNQETTTQFELIVGNDGQQLLGVPALEQVSSLGFQLVNALVEQLHGHMTVSQAQGTEFKLYFVHSEATSSSL